MEFLLQGLKAAAELTRLRLLTLCAHGELTVSELVRILGQSQPRLSRHLKLMMEAGLLERHQEGVRAFYRLSSGGECAELAQALVDLLPIDSDILAVDLARLEEVKASRAERAEAFFRDNASKWEDLRGLHVDEEQVDSLLRELILAEPVRDLLDVGTGTGRVLRSVGGEIANAVGIDKSREMLAIARINLDRDGLRNCHVRHADMYHLPFGGERFDLICANMLMRYAERPGAVIAEAARVLRPGGRLIVVDFAPHEMTELRDQFAHAKLGFADEEVTTMFDSAGLETAEPRILRGDPLTVCIWTGRKPAAAANDLPTWASGAGR
jgi:ubiquinone/menaquinone biosynthesis C-methylase UbiE/DNA-binding transcriptional ArsR family regulator